jgi:Protein of unknown function (DUF3224)
MKPARLTILWTICLSLFLSAAAIAQTNRGATVTPQTAQATGTFEVKIDPQPAEPKAGGDALSRLLIDKQFHGDLEGTSKGTMLAAGTAVKGSAGYVALEIVTGTLKGHAGTFVLQHIGTMTRGVPQLSVTVVPDSGTGQLVGLAGKMNIIIADGKHSYDFEYTLAETP